MPFDLEKYFPKREELEQLGALPSQESVEDYQSGIASNKRAAAILGQMIPRSQSQILLGLEPAKGDFNAIADANIAGMVDPSKQSDKYNSLLKTYRDSVSDDPAAKAELFRLQEKIRSSNDTAMESLKHKNALELLAKKAESGLREIVDPVTGETSVVSTKAPKEASQSQYAAAGFGKRTQEADKVFSDLEKGGYDRGATIGGRMGDILTSGWVPFGSEAVSTERQLQDQAERDFVNAVLRRESGSAIAPTEFSSAELQYFPRPGDSEEVKRRKARNRQIVISNLLAEGRPALGRLDENLAAYEGNVKSAPNKAQFDQDKIAEELKKRGL